MMSNEDLNKKIVIKIIWKQLLLAWLNKCIHPDTEVEELNTLYLSDIINKYKEDIRWSDYDRNILCTNDISSYIQFKYPELNVSNEKDIDKNQYIITSVLLFDCCMNSHNGQVHNDICKCLSQNQQEYVLKYCENLYKMDKTVSNVCMAIKEAIKSTDKITNTNIDINNGPSTSVKTFKNINDQPKNFKPTPINALPLFITKPVSSASLFSTSSSSVTIQESFENRNIKENINLDATSSHSAKMKHLHSNNTLTSTCKRHSTINKFKSIVNDVTNSDCAEMKHSKDCNTKFHCKLNTNANIFKTLHEEHLDIQDDIKDTHSLDHDMILSRDSNKNTYCIKPVRNESSQAYHSNYDGQSQYHNTIKKNKSSKSSGVSCYPDDIKNEAETVKNDLIKGLNELKLENYNKEHIIKPSITIFPKSIDSEKISNKTNNSKKIIEPSTGYKLKYVPDSRIDSPIKHYIRDSKGNKIAVRYPSPNIKIETQPQEPKLSENNNYEQRKIRSKRSSREEKFNKMAESCGIDYVPTHKIKENHQDDGLMHAVIDPIDRNEFKVTIQPLVENNKPVYGNKIKQKTQCNPITHKQSKIQQCEKSYILESLMKSMSDINILNSKDCENCSVKSRNKSIQYDPNRTVTVKMPPIQNFDQNPMSNNLKCDNLACKNLANNMPMDAVKRDEMAQYRRTGTCLDVQKQWDTGQKIDNSVACSCSDIRNNMSSTYTKDNSVSCSCGDVRTKDHAVSCSCYSPKYLKSKKSKEKPPRKDLMMIIIVLTFAVMILVTVLAIVMFKVSTIPDLPEETRDVAKTPAPIVVLSTLAEHPPLRSNAVVRPKYVRPYRIQQQLQLD